MVLKESMRLEIAPGFRNFLRKRKTSEDSYATATRIFWTTADDLVQNGILTPEVLEAGCRFYVCGIFLVCFLYCVIRASEKRAISSFPLSCMPRLIHSSIHP